MPSDTIAFLDIDHTIIRRSSVRRFISTGVRMGALPLRSLLSLPFYYVQYRLGRMSADVGERGFPELAGMSEQHLRLLARRSFDTRLKRDIFVEAEELIRVLRDRGCTVVLATSSIDLIVQPLATHLGVRHLLASALQFEAGICTGRFLSPPLLGDAKMRAAELFARQRGLALTGCAGYSDSIYDLPLLEAVGRPVAVNPDPRLRSVARARGWTSLRFERTVR